MPSLSAAQVKQEAAGHSELASIGHWNRCPGLFRTNLMMWGAGRGPAVSAQAGERSLRRTVRNPRSAPAGSSTRTSVRRLTSLRTR